MKNWSSNGLLSSRSPFFLALSIQTWHYFSLLLVRHMHKYGNSICCFSSLSDKRHFFFLCIQKCGRPAQMMSPGHEQKWALKCLPEWGLYLCLLCAKISSSKAFQFAQPCCRMEAVHLHFINRLCALCAHWDAQSLHLLSKIKSMVTGNIDTASDRHRRPDIR